MIPDVEGDVDLLVG